MLSFCLEYQRQSDRGELFNHCECIFDKRFWACFCFLPIVFQSNGIALAEVFFIIIIVNFLISVQFSFQDLPNICEREREREPWAMLCECVSHVMIAKCDEIFVT